MKLSTGCDVRQRGKVVELISQNFSFRLDTSRGLRALSWHNHLTGRAIALGRGNEVDVDLDAAERRLYIRGWRGIVSTDEVNSPDRDRGFREGLFRPEVDDSAWESSFSPANWAKHGMGWCWARTHLFLPEDCRSKPLSLVLGGVGLFDFRYMRVFVNGRVAGVRRVTRRWHEPGEFLLRDVQQHLRFGQDNVIALQLTDPIVRTPRMDELDPQAARSLPLFFLWPAQFEQHVRVGGDESRSPSLALRNWRVKRRGRASEVEFNLESPRKLGVRVSYRWDYESPTIRKTVVVTNNSTEPLRVMRLHLGGYATDARVTDGEQGFPVYANGEFFVTLAHPAGWATGQQGRVDLRQYPARKLERGESFESMEAVYGVAAKDQARPAFLDHLRTRMRRLRRGHDKPFAIYEPFGSWPLPKGKFLEDATSEKIILENVRKVDRGQRETKSRFDFYSIEFWADPAGDLVRPNPKNFPRGFEKVLREVRRLGVAPGLWICSSEGRWSNGANPVLSPSRGADPSWYAPPPDPAFSSSDARTVTYLCRASEPAKSMFATAFRHHLKHNGVRLLKFDGFYPICYNDGHASDHLPGIFSTEAICNSMIEFLRDLDAECPEAFIMLYWGYRSPWWLMYGDTLFEPGLLMEAASPSTSPTLFARDGVTQGLDQAQWFCEDVPAIGKDSLGVWLSDWGWNSCIGKERWQEAFVMDMCRGSLLAQPWSDHPWLTSAERKQFALLLEILRARPECFRNPRFILGNPWKSEPYGYSCSDGRRTFVAIHNCCWDDSIINLDALGVGESVAGSDIYRWYPDPSRIVGDATKLAMRPFDVVLLEFVPAGESPAIERRLPSVRLPQSFDETSRPVDVTVHRSRGPDAYGLSGQMSGTARGGTLIIAADRSRNGLAYQTRTVRLEMTLEGPSPITPAIGELTQHPTSWQSWRVEVPPSSKPARFAFTLKTDSPPDVRLSVHSWLIPRDRVRRR